MGISNDGPMNAHHSIHPMRCRRIIGRYFKHKKREGKNEDGRPSGSHPSFAKL